MKNGFLKSIVEKEIGYFLDKVRNPAISNSVTENPQPLYAVFPYFGPKSEKLKKEILQLAAKYFPTVSVRIILSNKFKIGSFFNYKDRMPPAVRSSLVYKFSCVVCTTSDYIGMTARSLSTRVAEHAGRSVRTGIPLSQPTHSAIREHVDRCGCNIEIDKFKILKQCNSDYTELKILESLYIFKHKPSLNLSNSSFQLAILK